MCISSLYESLPWTSARIRIRAATLDDAQFIKQLDAEPIVKRHLGGAQETPIEKIHHAIASGTLRYLMIDSADLEKALGYCLLLYNERAGGEDLLICLAPEHHGQGYGTEALQLMVQRFESSGSSSRLTISSTPENVAAQSALKRCGFACTSQYEEIPGFSFTRLVFTRDPSTQ